jgi:hypothetical protein
MLRRVPFAIVKHLTKPDQCFNERHLVCSTQMTKSSLSIKLNPSQKKKVGSSNYSPKAIGTARSRLICGSMGRIQSDNFLSQDNTCLLSGRPAYQDSGIHSRLIGNCFSSLHHFVCQRTTIVPCLVYGRCRLQHRLVYCLSD